MLPVIILFAKAPVPGRVKTRLAAQIGHEAAAGLHAASIADMLEMLASLGSTADLELHTDTETDAWRAAGVVRVLQCGGDLGRRMFFAMERALASGRGQVMIVGGDAPTLPASHLCQLLSSGADVALGPAEDGGYYAIACRRIHPEMFHGVHWSVPDTLQQTRRSIEACGLSVELGPVWFDVDTAADLERLRRAAFLPTHTAAWLESNLSAPDVK